MCVCSSFLVLFQLGAEAAASDKRVETTVLLLLSLWRRDSVAICKEPECFQPCGSTFRTERTCLGEFIQVFCSSITGRKESLTFKRGKFRSISFSFLILWFFSLMVLSVNCLLTLWDALCQPTIPNPTEKQHQGLKESRT